MSLRKAPASDRIDSQTSQDPLETTTTAKQASLNSNNTETLATRLLQPFVGDALMEEYEQ